MLKAVAAGFAVAFALLGPSAASADILITGAIRDRAGIAVAGARVTAYDAQDRPVGADIAIGDGTFAIGAREVPRSIGITCDYCRAVRRAIAPGEPVVVIVDRFNALTASGPTAADIRALPYRSAADLASLRPFAVQSGTTVAYLGLDQSAAVLIDGLPFYRAADDVDISQLVPAHATTALDPASPLEGPRYGGYSDAGIDNVLLRDPDVSTSRADTGDASDLVARVDAADGGVAYAASADDGDDRQLADASVGVPVGSGRLSLEALALSDQLLNATGAGLSYRTDSRQFETSAALRATQSDDASYIGASASIRDPGLSGLEFGVRAARATSSLPGSVGTQFDGAVYARAHRQAGASDISASLAVDSGSDAGSAGAARSTALIGSLSDDLRLGSHWMLQAGAVSNQRIPTFGELAFSAPGETSGDRRLLFDGSLTYTDLARLRVSALTFTQRATGFATDDENGIGIEGAWQIAPQLSLRSWLLRANQSSLAAQDAYAPASLGDSPFFGASTLTRQLIWLSYENHVRFDALIRAGAIEGDVRIPLSALYAFALGTAEYNGRRVTTFGVSLR